MKDPTKPEMADHQTEDLIERARQGSVVSQGRLVQLWYKRVYNFSFKFFGDHDMAMESAQKTFIAMYKNIGRLKDNGKFKTWLYSIAANQCREEWRKRKRSNLTSFEQLNGSEAKPVVTEWEIADQRHLNPESCMTQLEMEEILQQALILLPEEQRTVLIMKEYEGLKFREIALAIGVSENTVKSRLYYALEQLRKILKKQNLNKDSFGYEL